MVEADVATARDKRVFRRDSSRTRSRPGFEEVPRSPRPRLAEIRQGANLKLPPPVVVTGAVCVIEFLLVGTLGLTSRNLRKPTAF
jgi:hypothetical protein